MIKYGCYIDYEYDCRVYSECLIDDPVITCDETITCLPMQLGCQSKETCQFWREINELSNN